MSEVPAYSRLAGVYDEIVVDPCFPVWADFLEGLWADDPSGVCTVLDVCCGTGLMTAELASRGYVLTGVDASAEMLQRAHALLPDTVPLLQATLPELPVEGPFDAAVSTFDGLNYLDLPALRATFGALSETLRHGGWLAFDAHTDAMLQVTIDSPVIEGEQAGHPFVLTSVVDGRIVETRIDVEDEQGLFSETHRQFFHTGEEIATALADAGFQVLRVVHEYTDADADAQTLRATWIARRA